MNGEKKLCAVYTNEKKTSEHRIYLSGEIEGAGDYYEMFNVLAQSQSEDSVRIFINSIGGQVSTGVQIINAILNCKAKTTTILSGCAYSVASLILLSGKKIEVMPMSSFMAHSSYTWCSGSPREVKDKINHEKKWMQSIDRLYKKIFTDEEIEQLASNEKEIWLTSKELQTRLDNFMGTSNEQKINT